MMDTQTGVNNYPFLYFNDLNDPTKERYLCKDAVIACRSVLSEAYLLIAMTTVR